MEFVGIDWAYRRAAWCAVSASGAIVGEGVVPADEDGLARLVIDRGIEVCGVVEMMSGAIWVRDQLAAAGWEMKIAHARKVRDVAPLACKTDKVDARVPAMNRIFGLLTQWGTRLSLDRLRKPDGMRLLEQRGIPAVWRRSIREAIDVIDLLDSRIAPL